jgi:hypothetical protein
VKWRRKKRNKEENFITEIPMTTLARWYFYDAGLDEPNKMASVVGMIPDSVEGSEMEEEASDQRIARVMPLIPYIETMTEINARSFAELQFDHYFETNQLDPAKLTDEKEVVEELYRQVSYSALLSAFAGALELGIISTDTVKGDIR